MTLGIIRIIGGCLSKTYRVTYNYVANKYLCLHIERRQRHCDIISKQLLHFKKSSKMGPCLRSSFVPSLRGSALTTPSVASVSEEFLQKPRELCSVSCPSSLSDTHGLVLGGYSPLLLRPRRLRVPKGCFSVDAETNEPGEQLIWFLTQLPQFFVAILALTFSWFHFFLFFETAITQ